MKMALRIYKLAFMTGLLIWVCLMIYDDYDLLIRSWKTSWWKHLLLWLAYFVIFFGAFSVVYWILYIAFAKGLRRKN